MRNGSLYINPLLQKGLATPLLKTITEGQLAALDTPRKVSRTSLDVEKELKDQTEKDKQSTERIAAAENQSESRAASSKAKTMARKVAAASKRKMPELEPVEQKLVDECTFQFTWYLRNIDPTNAVVESFGFLGLCSCMNGQLILDGGKLCKGFSAYRKFVKSDAYRRARLKLTFHGYRNCTACVYTCTADLVCIVSSCQWAHAKHT